ncbi:Hypothetical protein A7982_08750 [Minicystis rosea]|nr:Hypothetical protein A7982_08750 [Minicystis rosea]
MLHDGRSLVGRRGRSSRIGGRTTRDRPLLAIATRARRGRHSLAPRGPETIEVLGRKGVISQTSPGHSDCESREWPALHESVPS